MRKKYFAIIIICCLLAFSPAWAEKAVEKQVNKGNIVKTINYYDDRDVLTRTEVIYSDPGIVRIVIHYDPQGKKKERMVTFFTEKFVRENGVFRNTVYYDGEGRKIRDESEAKDQNVIRMVTLYDPQGKKISQENIFTEKVAREKGFERGIMMYDRGSQKIVRQEFYFQNALVGVKDATGKALPVPKALPGKTAGESPPLLTADGPAKKQTTFATSAVPAKASPSVKLAVPDFLREPVVLSDRTITPTRIETRLKANAFSQLQHTGAVTAAKEAIRLVAGAASPERERVFESRWAPLYDYPEPGLTVYLNRVNPLLLNYAALHNAMGRAGLEHDQAVASAQGAAKTGDEAGAVNALAVVHQKQLAMAAILRQMEGVAGQIKSQGKPPDPRKAKARAKKRHETAVARLLPALEGGELDGYWISEEQWTYYTYTGMGTSQAQSHAHIFQPSFFFKKVKKVDDRVEIYFLRDFFPKPYGNGEPGERRILVVLEREAGGYYGRYGDMDYPAGRQSYLASGGYARYQAEWFPTEFVSAKGQIAGVRTARKDKYATWLPGRLPSDLESLAKMSPEQLIGLVRAKYPKINIEELVKTHRQGKEQFTSARATPVTAVQTAKSVKAATPAPPPVANAAPAPGKREEEERQERIRERESLIAFFQTDISRLQDQLRTNPKQADYINWLIMNRKSDIILEQDRIREIKTGEFIRSRTPFDDHCLAQIVVSAQKEVSRMAAANRDYRATVALIGKLPYEEQQQAWKTLNHTVKSGGSTNPEVIGKLKNALRNKYQGRLDQDAAQAEEKMADADDLVTRAEKVKGSADAAVSLLSLVVPGGQTVDKVYRSFTGSIDAVTDPDATAEGGAAQAGLNILEVWTGDILEKTRFKQWKDGLSAVAGGLNTAQKEFQKARKDGKEKPGVEAVAQGLSTGIWSYVTGKSGDRLMEAGGKAGGMAVDQCLQAVNAAPGTLNAFLSREPGQDEIPGVDKLLAQGAITELDYLQRQLNPKLVAPPGAPAGSLGGKKEPAVLMNLKKQAPVSADRIDRLIIPDLQRQGKKSGGNASDPAGSLLLMEFQTGGQSIGQVIDEIEKIAAHLQQKKK